MSSESGQPVRRDRRFATTVALTVAVLLVLTAALTAANAVRGPRLAAANVSPESLVTRSGHLELRADQRIETVRASDVSIAPTVGFDVATEEATLLVRFTEALRYSTTYVVTASVRSVTTGAAATLRYSFETPAAELFALRRAGPAAAGTRVRADDEIVRWRPDAAEQVLYRAPRIQDFAVAEPAVAAITLDAQNVGTLSVSRLGAVDAPPAAPRTIVRQDDITEVRSSGPGGVFGFVVNTYPEANVLPNRLFLYDPDGAGTMTPVLGRDKKPLSVNNWDFVPGTTSIVIQTADSEVYLVDPLEGGPLRPLGAHVLVQGFIPGTATLVVEDLDKNTAIDLATGRATLRPAARLAADAQLNEVLPTAGKDRSVLLVAQVTGERLEYRLLDTEGTTTRVLYQPPAGIRLQRLCSSPNGQYLSVEENPWNSAVDDYLNTPGFSPSSTVLLDRASGQRVHLVPGFLVDWCG